jgi:thiamine-monophosphate kinase
LPTVTADWLQAYARGLNRMAQSCGVALVGGDTTRGPLSMTMTVFGRVPAGQALSRSGAQPGDLLCVGGELGNAAGALPLVLGERLPNLPSPSRWRTTGRRNRNWRWAGIAWQGHGGAGHLRRLARRLRAYRAGLEGRLQVERERLPLSDALVAFLGRGPSAALSGGDDYVLAFTLPSVELPPLLAEVGRSM